MPNWGTNMEPTSKAGNTLDIADLKQDNCLVTLDQTNNTTQTNGTYTIRIGGLCTKVYSYQKM